MLKSEGKYESVKDLSHLFRGFSPFSSCQRSSVLKKVKSLTKLHLDLEIHVPSGRQKTFEGKRMLYPTVNAKVKLCRETMILVCCNSSALPSFASVESTTLLTKAA